MNSCDGLTACRLNSANIGIMIMKEGEGEAAGSCISDEKTSEDVPEGNPFVGVCLFNKGNVGTCCPHRFFNDENICF